MAKTEFSDFAQALGALISDGQRNGLFVQTLLEAIVDYEDDDDNPLFKTTRIRTSAITADAEKSRSWLPRSLVT